MRRYIYILLMIIIPTIMLAQHVRVAAPRQVIVGEQFQVEYTVYTDNVENFKFGKLPNGIEVLAGPYVAKQSSYQVTNGHTSSSSSVSFDYVLMATKKGNFTLPPARITVNGQNIASTPVKFSASGNVNVSRSANMNRSYGNEIEITRPESKNIGSKDLFIKVTANKTKIHEQEPVVLTYKVYTSVDLVSLAGKMPDLTGFHVQEVKLPQQKSFHLETLNGRKYKCTTWSQYVLFPQVTGKIKVSAINFHGKIRPSFNDFDPFAFMSNGDDIDKDVVAPSVVLNVMPLPQQPDGFSGGVGKFNISAQLDKRESKEGVPVKLRVIVSGAGNLKLIKQPTVSFPKEFDVYDPKVIDKTKLGGRGSEGSMIYDFIAVPRTKGEYTLPSVKFVFFDTSSNSYKTVQTQSFKINVAKGDGTSESLVQQAGNGNSDIRGLKTGKSQLDGVKSFFGSVAYWLTLLLVILLFIILLRLMKKRSHLNSDIVLLKEKNAQKVAVKRMRKAHQLMIHGKSTEFYDEILHALWGYIGDKLNIPVEQLSRNNINEVFTNRDVDKDTVNKFIEALEECEFQRYAPGDENGNMKITYDKSILAISEVESVIDDSKRNIKTSKMMSSVFILIFGGLLWAMPALSQNKEQADEAYQRGDYEYAIKTYKAVISKESTADCYYNLGNAYYKNNDIPKAIIAYERALRLSPSDKDIIYNLQLAQSKTFDQLSPKSEMFFISWLKSLIDSMSIDGWAYLSIISLCLAFALTLLYLFAQRVGLKKLGFFLAMLSFFIFIVSSIFAFYKHSIMINNHSAIVIAPTACVKITPDSKAKNIIVIHEGTKLNVTDRTLGDWYGVTLSNGDAGWIKTTLIEEI